MTIKSWRYRGPIHSFIARFAYSLGFATCDTLDGGVKFVHKSNL